MSIERRLINPQQGDLDTILPDAVAYRAADRDLFVANVDVTFSVIVRAQAGQLVNGLLSVTLAAGANVLFVTDGVGWRAIGTGLVGTSSTALECARVFNSANESIGSGAFTALTFDSTRYNVGGLFNGGVFNERFTAINPGKYLIGAAIAFTASALGALRYLALKVNGTTFIGLQQGPVSAASTGDIVVSGVYQMAAGDYVQALAFQDTGGALNVVASGNFSPEFWIQRLQ